MYGINICNICGGYEGTAQLQATAAIGEHLSHFCMCPVIFIAELSIELHYSRNI